MHAASCVRQSPEPQLSSEMQSNGLGMMCGNSWISAEPDLHSHVVQELAAGLKAEVRELLKTHGVDNFVLKPVRRSYAFELGEVPRGEQWVLKARYAASKPTLPLGLSGKPPLRLSAL